MLESDFFFFLFFFQMVNIYIYFFLNFKKVTMTCIILYLHGEKGTSNTFLNIDVITFRLCKIIHFCWCYVDVRLNKTHGYVTFSCFFLFISIMFGKNLSYFWFVAWFDFFIYSFKNSAFDNSLFFFIEIIFYKKKKYNKLYLRK